MLSSNRSLCGRTITASRIVRSANNHLHSTVSGVTTVEPVVELYVEMLKPGAQQISTWMSRVSADEAFVIKPLADDNSEETGTTVQVDVRMCKECQRTIFSKADFDRELSTQPVDQRAYQRLDQFEHGIRQLLPTFQRLLLVLQDPEKPPTPAQLAQATRLRKRLTDAFTQYELAARRIRELPTTSATQDRLQKAVHQQAMSFLYVHMLPLKSIPKLIKHAAPNGTQSPRPEGSRPNALASIKFDSERPGGSRASSHSSAAITALEAEEKELRERLIVLEEQQFFVSGMIAEANKRRRFDEVSALSSNVADLGREIDQIRGQLAQMDFAGAYASDVGVK